MFLVSFVLYAPFLLLFYFRVGKGRREHVIFVHEPGNV